MPSIHDRFLGTIPKYRLHRASGQAVVTIAGVDHYLGPFGTKASKAQYDRLIAEWLAAGRPSAAAVQGAADLSINELLLAYLSYAEKYYVSNGKSSAEVGCIKDAMRPLKQLYGKSPVTGFGPLSLRAVREKMIERKWSRTYINHQVNRLRRVFKWGVENELVPPSVLHGLPAVAPLRYGKTEAKETAPIVSVPDDAIEAVVQVVSPPVAAMIQLQRVTGMRSGEVVAMRTCDIDTSGDVWIYRPNSHKNRWRGHERIVYLGPKAQAIIRVILKPDNAEAFLFSPADAMKAHHQRRHRERRTPLSCGNRPGTNRTKKPTRVAGDRYDTKSYRRAITYGAKKAGVHSWHPHQLRHNYATEVRREFGVEVARIVLGHKTAAVTELYAEADQNKAAEIAARIG